jgi:hypothetical protein
MITLLFLLLQLTFTSAQPQPVMDVPAILASRPASHPCNLPSGGRDGMVYAVCVTGDETYWTCADMSRILLTAENGMKHCISFAAIEDKNL